MQRPLQFIDIYYTCHSKCCVVTKEIKKWNEINNRAHSLSIRVLHGRRGWDVKTEWVERLWWKSHNDMKVRLRWALKTSVTLCRVLVRIVTCYIFIDFLIMIFHIYIFIIIFSYLYFHLRSRHRTPLTVKVVSLIHGKRWIPEWEVTTIISKCYPFAKVCKCST